MAVSSVSTQNSASYSAAQIVLHWLIAGLVIWELFFGRHPRPSRESIALQDIWTGTLSSSHVWIGLLILALVLVRVAIRVTRGAPPSEETNRLQALAARVTHALFYVMLFFMPMTGIFAYYVALPTGDLHELGEPVFIALIAVHVAATAWHQFVKRDGIMRRITVPAR